MSSSRVGDRGARVRAPARPVAAALGALRASRSAGRRSAHLARLARGGRISRAEHPRAPRTAAARRSSSSSGVRRGSRMRACDGSASAAATSSGAAGRERRASARLLRARARRLAGLRDAPPSAVHALAPLVRRDRRGVLPPHSTCARLLVALAAFFLAVGIGAHALDELNGHPLRTRDLRSRPGRAGSGLDRRSGGARRLLRRFATRRGWRRSSPPARFIVCAYNLELFGGAFHSDTWFAVAWGSFPLLAAYLVAAERITIGGAARGRLRGLPEPRPAAPLDAGADDAPAGRRRSRGRSSWPTGAGSRSPLRR